MLKLHIRRTERILKDEGVEAALKNIETINPKYKEEVKAEFKHLYK